MKYRLLSVFVIVAICFPFSDYAGISMISSHYILVNQKNYKAFQITDRPDSVVMVLKYGIDNYDIKALDTSLKRASEREKDIFKFIETDAKANEKVIAYLVSHKTISFVRCYYYNANKIVFKYKDIAADGKVIREMYITDTKENLLECINYSATGALLSKAQYKYYDTILNASWFSTERASLVKINKESFYYGTGELRAEAFYNRNSKKRDSVISYNKNGKTIAKTIKGKTTKYDQHGNMVAGKADANKKALLIGIDNYMDDRKVESKISFPNIDGCVTDVKSIRNAINVVYDVPDSNIVSLTNAAATKNGILAAFNKLIDNAKRGDVIFIHVSSHGSEFYDSLARDTYFGVVCSNFNYEKSFSDGIISEFQLQNFFSGIRKKIGRSGQLIISLDMSHSGALAKGDHKSDDGKNDTVSLRGESNSILLNITSGNTSPVVIFTASTGNQFASEMHDENDQPMGAYTWALLSAFKNIGSGALTDDIFEELKNNLQGAGKNQTPCLYETHPQILFEGGDEEEKKAATLPEIKTKSKCFTISVGISDYKSDNKSRNFNNCTSDAGAYARFFSAAFSEAGDSLKLFSSLLVNSDATKDNILKSINNAISNSRPEDYFIFNFSGYCRKLVDSGGKQNTYFVPYGLNNIDDTNEVRKKSISLTQLKDLLQLIPANNQLFITEAGSTDDFQKEFIQALIESSPTIASLSNKNRFFIVPKGTGLDRFNCRSMSVEHGPLNYYVTTLPKELNIFGLFDSSNYSDAITYALNKKEMDCDYFRSGYFDIFSERKFMKDMRSYLPEELMQTRGLNIVVKERGEISSSISHRYALVIGNDKYDGKPNWRDLNNPVFDATDVAYELENGYDFKVFLLTNAKADSVYWYISYLAHLLQPTDQLLIYAAGHGDYDANLFDDGFIVCKDSKPIAEDPYRSSYIQFSRLSRMVNKLPSRQILMMLDVCFGGAFDSRVALNKTRGDGYADLSNAELFTKKLKMKTRIYITSGGKQEVPDGYKGKHSPFAQRIIQALQTRGGNEKILTATNLYDFVQKLPSGPLKGSFEDDEPGSEFLLLAR